MQPDSPNVFARLRDALAGGGWRLKARPEQLPPKEWLDSTASVWAIMAGRGWGKTRTGAETVQEAVMTGAARHIALIGPTASDVRDVMVEGPSGILSIAPDHARPTYEPSKRRLTWPNGSTASCYSADEPERLRGPEHDLVWADEVGAWKDPMAWSNMVFGLRRLRPDGKGGPRIVVTTTPRPTKIMRDLMARVGADVILTRGKTMDNAANLAPAAVAQMMSRYGGTRIGRQELDGELLLDTLGALWTRDMIDEARQGEAPPLRRIVVAVDPAMSNSEGSDETGIIVAGIGRQRDDEGNEHGYILADLTGKYSPHEWADVVCQAYDDHKADRVIAEVNNGGELVRHTIQTVKNSISFKPVHASRGKVTRAEPVAALYEQGRVHHVGADLMRLEDQMSEFTSDFDRRRMGYSPDRVDALVWAISELMLDAQAPMIITDEFMETLATMAPLPGSPAWQRQNPYGTAPYGGGSGYDTAASLAGMAGYFRRK